MRLTLRPLVAEFVGTFGLVFIAAGVLVMDTSRGGMIGAVGLALAPGLAYAVLVTATMGISGGHLNPAVTFGSWIAGRIDAPRAGYYIVAQLAGAVVGALCVKWLLPAAAGEALGYGVPRIADGVTFTHALFIEAVLTFLLVSVFFGTVVSPDAPKVGGFGVGLVLVFGALVATPLTDAAVNPARAFGPALVAMDWNAQLAYWIGPALGAAVAAFIWAKLLLPLRTPSSEAPGRKAGA